ncbi:uncharacterized protein [Onthophagus taurus]|uniref:uncharacterized protein n=1 Tax=Onthophagus taurus TaxID=166361 RepID=UPI0039BDFDD6
MTPYLKRFVSRLVDVAENVQKEQERRKQYADIYRRPAPDYQPGQMVLIRSHELSKGSKGFTSKLAPKRDGPYAIRKGISATTYEIEEPKTNRIIGKFHASELTPFVGAPVPPTLPRRKRGRPPKVLNHNGGPNHGSEQVNGPRTAAKPKIQQMMAQDQSIRKSITKQQGHT